jgi:hypothetical protein
MAGTNPNPVPPVEADKLVGEVIDPGYRIVAVLGAGGMGVV